MKKTQKEIESLVEALDDVPVDPSDERDAVQRLGIDVKAMAAGLREKMRAADALDLDARVQRARRDYAAEVEKLERRRSGKKPREEQLAIFRSLLARVPPQMNVAVHFHKYETATDEELVALTHALQHLLGEDDDE